MSTNKPSSPSYSASQSDAPVTCPYCQRRFDKLDQLTLHVVTRHTWSGKVRPQEASTGGKR
jgi:hypothetical protein